MKEEFLNFIWENQYYDKKDLRTEELDPIQVISTGKLNRHSGPDFSEARIKIGNTYWVGQVEIHVRSVDWFLHRHHTNPAYDQVILHVVWVNNKPVFTSEKRKVPTLVLQSRINNALLLRQNALKNSTAGIPCGPNFKEVQHSIIDRMLNKVIEQRIVRKSDEVLYHLQLHGGDWDQVTYLYYGRNFGFYTNRDPFWQLVKSVPLNIVKKIRSNLFQLEAIFFGQAGFLGATTGDSYYNSLQAEYEYLQKKFSLPTVAFRPGVWKYLRLRPSNFPGLRIAQFAAFVHSEGFRFSKIRDLEHGALPLIQIKPSAYWRNHFDFGKTNDSGYGFGKQSQDNLTINTIVPLLAGYAKYSGQSSYWQKAYKILELLPAERNHILQNWKEIGFEVSSALRSQSLLELQQEFCSMKKCLACEIGKSLLAKSAK